MSNFDDRVNLGSVYVLTNPAMPGLVKVGHTCGSVKLRANKLSEPTGVPGKFLVAYSCQTENPKQIERLVHLDLAPHRIKGKEFFRVSVVTARQSIVSQIRTVAAEGALSDESIIHPSTFAVNVPNWQPHGAQSSEVPSFALVKRANVICASCGRAYSQALLRPENRVACPDCLFHQELVVDWG